MSKRKKKKKPRKKKPRTKEGTAAAKKTKQEPKKAAAAEVEEAKEPAFVAPKPEKPTKDEISPSSGQPVVPFSASTDPTGGEDSYILSSWVFFRVLGLIYVFAFVSAWVQITGLVGEQGILPIKASVDAMVRSGNAEYYWWRPMLLWFNQSDAFLHFLCGAGAVCGMLLLAGIAPLLASIGAWVLYLSIVYAGQVFFLYQWDTLLLEVGFLAIFLASWRLWPRLKKAQEPPLVVLWMFRLLLFRLMFFSGYVKLASGDPTWRNLSALEFHYWSQPLPSWISWYAHQLPSLFHKASVLLMLAIELLVPFFLLATRRPRMLAGLAMIGLQVVIALTGNYGFFNLLSAALCLLLLDDATLRQVLPEGLLRSVPPVLEPPEPPVWERTLRAGVLVVVLPLLLVFGVYKEAQRFTRFSAPVKKEAKGWYQKINRAAAMPFKATLRAIALKRQSKTFRKWYYRASALRVVNRYGLFASMTTKRPELIIQGSDDDGKTWKTYKFKWKISDRKRTPGIAGPHMPRLDWQMWFAALRTRPHPPRWLYKFSKKLRAGSPAVLGLLEHNPFPSKPPRRIRAQLFYYTFSSPKLKSSTGMWWERRFLRAIDL